MALLRCFTFIEQRQKPNPEISMALLHQSHEEDDDHDTNNNNKKAAHDLHGDLGGVKRFTMDEINKLRKLSTSFPWLVGYGEFSLSHLDHKFPYSSGGVTLVFYGEKTFPIFKQELQILPLLHHQNLVKLHGFCDDDQGRGVLVLENGGNQTLRAKMTLNRSPLPWKSRVKIAYQLVQVLEYLHSQEIVHGDIHPTNVMLDKKLDCKLWNFRAARMGKLDGPVSLPPSGHQFILDSPGYTDFHYLSTGVALKQHDMYSLGIILLELITGSEAAQLHSGGCVESLADAILREDEATLLKMVDPRLGGREVNLGEAMTMASVSALCLQKSISLRPCASEVAQQLRNSIHSADSA